MKNIGVILSILALFTAVMGLALAMAAFFASLCAFVCVLERLTSRLNLTADAEEEPKVEKIQFDLDTND